MPHHPLCKPPEECICDLGKNNRRTMGLALAPVPPVPERVRLYPFHRPYGAMVVDLGDITAEGVPEGVKPIETRGGPCPTPGWIAVYNAKKTVRLQPLAEELSRAAPYLPQKGRHNEAAQAALEERLGPPGMVIGMVYCTGSRPLQPEDFPRSFFFEPGRYAWTLAHPKRFPSPLTLADLGVAHAPQNAVYVPGALLALGAGLTLTRSTP